MANPQLVTYIKQQLQLGESEIPIKNSLRSVGWSDSDVAEAFKSINPTAPSVSVPPPGMSPSNSFQKPTAEPKKIDLGAFAPITTPSISRATASPATVSFSSQKPAENSFTPQSGASNASFAAAVQEGGKKSSWVSTLLMGVVIVALAALSGLLYKNNADLKTKVTEFTNQVAALTTKVGSSGDGTASLNQRIAVLEENLKDVDSQLALFLPLQMVTSTVVSTSSPTSTPTIVSSVQPLTLKGVLSGGGTANYVLTTSKGIKVSIKNSKDAKVVAAFGPLLNNSIELTGTPTSGAREITVTHVNGAPLQ